MRLAILLCALAGAGCDPSPDEACTDDATARCALTDRCLHHGSDAYGGYGACIARLRARCTSALAAPGSGSSVGSTEVCAHALAGVSCDAFRSGDPSPACRAPAGALAEGTRCRFDTQCATAFCRVPQAAGCGACAKVTVEGDPCPDGSCSAGLVCGGDQVCRPFAAAGAPCDATRLCAPGFACAGGTTTLLGACARAVAAAGAACDASSVAAADCDPGAGLFCDGGVCRAVADARPGGGCGRGIECAAGEACFGMSCIADGADGAACDSSTGPGCLAPAVCLGGRCVFPYANACR